MKKEEIIEKLELFKTAIEQNVIELAGLRKRIDVELKERIGLLHKIEDRLADFIYYLEMEDGK